MNKKRCISWILSLVRRRPRSEAQTFYTIDRIGKLTQGLELRPDFDLTGFRMTQVTGVYDSAEMYRELKAEFPLGITRHGKWYLFHDSLLYPTVPGVPPLTPLTPNIELVYELVRRLEFSDRPTRMSSIFGFGSIEDARTFRSQAGSPSARIFKLRCEQAFRADMRLLQLGASTMGAWLQARKYWRGEPGPTPLWEYLLVPPVTVLEEAQ